MDSFFSAATGFLLPQSIQSVFQFYFYYLNIFIYLQLRDCPCLRMKGEKMSIIYFNGLPQRRFEKKDVRITIHTTQSRNEKLEHLSLLTGMTKNGLINLILDSLDDWFSIS